MEQRVGVLVPGRGEQRLALGLVVPVDDGDPGASSPAGADADDAVGETRVVDVAQVAADTVAVDVAAQLVVERRK